MCYQLKKKGIKLNIIGKTESNKILVESNIIEEADNESNKIEGAESNKIVRAESSKIEGVESNKMEGIKSNKIERAESSKIEQVDLNKSASKSIIESIQSMDGTTQLIRGDVIAIKHSVIFIL